MKLLLFILYFFIEIYLIVEFADEFGIFSLFVEMIVSAFVGIAIIISQRNVMVVAYLNRANVMKLFGKSFFRLIGGILLILPGILSDIIGAILFVISLFFSLRSDKINDNFCRDYESNSDESSDIIDVEIVESSDTLKHDKKM